MKKSGSSRRITRPSESCFLGPASRCFLAGGLDASLGEGTALKKLVRAGVVFFAFCLEEEEEVEEEEVEAAGDNSVVVPETRGIS